MAKFCTKCGRRLIDGQPCSCTQTQQPVHDMQESVQKEVKDKAKNFFTQALEMIKHPSTGFVEAVSDKDSKNGLILMGIEAVLTGLYLYVLLQKYRIRNNERDQQCFRNIKNGSTDTFTWRILLDMGSLLRSSYHL